MSETWALMRGWEGVTSKGREWAVVSFLHRLTIYGPEEHQRAVVSFLRRLTIYGPRSTKGRSSPVAVPSEQELMVACPTSGERGSRHLDIVAGRSRGQGRVTEPCVSSRGVVSRCDHTVELPSPETWTSARPPLPQGHSERPGWRPREAGRRRRCSVTKRPAPHLQRMF